MNPPVNLGHTWQNLAAFGKLEAFQEGEETITEYLERVELYFQTNDIADDKKVPVLLSVIGAKTYTLLRSLVTPTAPKDKSFKDISEALWTQANQSSREILFSA